MGIYEEFNIPTVINAAGTYTVWGGSCMSQKTLDDMAQAAKHFVSIRDLQKAVFAKIAEVTHNEAAYVSNGAATGLYLAIAACLQKKANKPLYYMEKDEISQYNVAVFRSHRNPYDLVMKHLGLNYHEAGFPNIILPATKEDVLAAVDDKTVAFYFAQSTWTADGAMSFEDTVKLCNEIGLPIIVDAAAQLPSKTNLWYYTKSGADIALFSGGKDLRGPQSSGLVVGKQAIIDEMVKIGFPNYGIGRMMKVGREELIGLYSAIVQYVERDEEAYTNSCNQQVDFMLEALSEIEQITAAYSFPNEAGQPIPRVKITTKHEDIKTLYETLLQNGILTGLENHCLYINPMTLEDKQHEYIVSQIKKIYTA